jgi:hypothetical protein
MQILLPKKKDSEQITLDTKSIVVVGANGSGKTRFGTDIETRNLHKTHRISAQKSLTMPEHVSTTTKSNAETDFLYGNPTNGRNNKTGYRWGSKPNTFLLNDYPKLMVLLHTEEYEDSIAFKNSYTPGQQTDKPLSKLDRVKIIWEEVLPHRKLNIKAGTIETYPSGSPEQKYNASEMSDGERIVFYLIGEVISVPENSIVIIDEPEMHIHKSITKKLWDEVEKERLDCTFIYLTHDLDFAFSRQESTKIWSKSFDGNQWDYELLNGESDLPEQLYLEILGSRKPILFIEGNDSSIDYKLLPLVFPNYTVKPLGSCHKVFSSTKSFNEQKEFHHIESCGLIDRDRRTNEEISNINNPNIWVAEVSEIENFLLIERVVKVVATSMMKNPSSVWDSVKTNIVDFFNSEIQKQALEHTIHRVERILNKVTDNSTVKDIEEFNTAMNNFWESKDFKSIYNSLIVEFQNYVANKDIDNILRVFNNKGLVSKSKVVELCDLNTKNNAYLNYIIGIFKQRNISSEEIRNAMIEKIKQ